MQKESFHSWITATCWYHGEGNCGERKIRWEISGFELVIEFFVTLRRDFWRESSSFFGLRRRKIWISDILLFPEVKASSGISDSWFITTKIGSIYLLKVWRRGWWVWWHCKLRRRRKLQVIINLQTHFRCTTAKHQRRPLLYWNRKELKVREDEEGEEKILSRKSLLNK